MTVTVTKARAVSVYETTSASSIPSPSGETTGGAAASPTTIGEEAGGGSGGALPIVPDAGRVCGPASIVHVYEPFAIRAAFHVQATAVPEPRPRATRAPEAPLTVTVQAPGAESVAVNRTGPPRPPTACGAYSFGSPVAATIRAMSGSLPYRAAPGQLVGPVSR